MPCSNSDLANTGATDEKYLQFHELRRTCRHYLRYHEEKRPEDSWAFDRVSEIVRDEPDVALELTLLLFKKAGDDDAVLAYVAAGPLEDLLKLHGLHVIDRLEQESTTDPRLQLALSGVWGIDSGHPLFERWYALMSKYGFSEGKRQPLQWRNIAITLIEVLDSNGYVGAGLVDSYTGDSSDSLLNHVVAAVGKLDTVGKNTKGLAGAVRSLPIFCHLAF